jgi:isoleucyl-tRNA synthetase
VRADALARRAPTDTPLHRKHPGDPMTADDLSRDKTAPDYKHTLFLPAPDFPMRAGLPKREPEWLSRWEGMDLYARLRAEAAGREKFELHDGPPYANGHLHIGHALNKILKDFVVRSQQMLGKDSRYIPGWDCHGLPIEWKIEEQYRAKGKNKDEVPVNELRRQCRAFADEWVDVQRSEFKRLGVSGDWDHPYLTMDFDAEAVIAEEFMKFVMNGSLYRGSKPVMWSVVEKTALAEAEVEYHEHQSTTIWVKFPAITVPARPGRRQGRNLDHDALDHPPEPRGLLQPRSRLRPLRGHGPPRGVLGAHRRPLSAGRRAGRGRADRRAA